MEELNYVVLGSKPWNRTVFDQCLANQPGQWHFIASPEDLKLERIEGLNPRYLFFIHWSWKVDAEIVNNYECVCFHMTDVPYGRGGSPLQNLILNGHSFTKLAALQMTEAFDAGPVYLKTDLGLSGNAEEIYIRSTYLSAEMIQDIVQLNPKPMPQTGEVTVFKRRQPAQSEITEPNSLRELYDFVRMLDAEGYPKAFFEYQGFRYEFSRAALQHGRMVSDVTITPLSPA
ncbi:MAG: methionyl-tRNA formyltransferase [Cyanobacteria bacterium J06648_16]